MRNPGTHMAVCEDGSFAGSLSGGCIENAVVAEALQALEQQESRIVRFGAGSPYLDIALPCGGGLDIHFQPLTDVQFAEECCGALDRRAPFTVKLGEDVPHFAEGWQKLTFSPTTGQTSISHWPTPRIAIVGHGAGVAALSRLAAAMEIECIGLTPDQRVLDELQQVSIPAARLERTSDTHFLSGDPWTAFVFLFHDHDWEVQLMAKALELPHFFIGAMGSRRAHAARCEALAAAGVSEQAIASVAAPIGLFHSSRDPETLALSTLSQVVQAYQQADFTSFHG